MSLLEGIHLVDWSAELETGRRFMDTSTHTVKPEFLAQGITYTFKILAPPGLHPDELLTAIKGVKVTAVVEAAPALGEAQEKLLDERLKHKATAQALSAERTKTAELEKKLKKALLEKGAREQEDKDNKARLDALALIGTTVSDRGVEQLVQTELDVWLRGLDDFNMTGGEAKELVEAMTRLVKETFARVEVLRDRQRCAVLLESLQRERDGQTSKPVPTVVSDEDQLF